MSWFKRSSSYYKDYLKHLPINKFLRQMYLRNFIDSNIGKLVEIDNANGKNVESLSNLGKNLFKTDPYGMIGMRLGATLYRSSPRTIGDLRFKALEKEYSVRGDAKEIKNFLRSFMIILSKERISHLSKENIFENMIKDNGGFVEMFKSLNFNDLISYYRSILLDPDIYCIFASYAQSETLEKIICDKFIEESRDIDILIHFYIQTLMKRLPKKIEDIVRKNHAKWEEYVELMKTIKKKVK